MREKLTSDSEMRKGIKRRFFGGDRRKGSGYESDQEGGTSSALDSDVEQPTRPPKSHPYLISYFDYMIFTILAFVSESSCTYCIEVEHEKYSIAPRIKIENTPQEMAI